MVRKLDRATILSSFAKKPSPISIERETTRTYVRQLEAIEADFEDILQAVNDFLMSYYDRIVWAQKGLVHDISFDEYEEALIRTWKNHHKLVSIGHKHLTDIERGNVLYGLCSQHTAKLEGLETPDHFTAGSFHAISDEETIGWHPDYKVELKKF